MAMKPHGREHIYYCPRSSRTPIRADWFRRQKTIFRATVNVGMKLSTSLTAREPRATPNLPRSTPFQQV